MYSAIARNKRNTVIIMAVFVALIAGLGWLFSQYYQSTGIFWGALVGGGLYALFQYFAASKLALAMNGATEIQKRDNPRLYRIVENITISQGMPMPKVYVVDDPAANAFATGRDPEHAHVAATSGLLDVMNDRELQGVMAHELGHVKNYDIRVSMIVLGLVSAIGLIADIFLRLTWFRSGDNRESSNSPVFLLLGVVAAVLAPFISMLVQLAVSRQREYLADATGAMSTRDPEALASALEKLAQVSTKPRRQNTSTAHLFFANPLKKKSLTSLFSTHPPLEERVARLREIGVKM